MDSLHLDHIWRRTSAGILAALVRRKSARAWLLRTAEKRLRRNLVDQNPDDRPRKVQEERTIVIRNLLRRIAGAIEDGRIGRRVLRRVLTNFVGNVVAGESERMAPFRARHGSYPPAFITLSPTKLCNLRCTGCYAASCATTKDALSFEIASRLIRDKTEDWGSFFTVISGGEPLLYRSDGKTIFDLFAAHPDNYFMMYTNGTLIDEEVADRLAGLGNVAPAISIEGLEKETDARRGPGVFRKILRAMANLRRAGVPFGVSLTATRLNAEVLLSDACMDLCFEREGAVFGWIFQYMPIGRSYTLDLMVTPEQRMWMYERTVQLIHERELFLVDFWNSGPVSSGCLSAGRAGGYIYVIWNGDITPCVFVPYAVDNVNDIYARGDRITSALSLPVMRTIRKWQLAYGYGKPAGQVHNWIVPCPIRDHYRFLRTLVERHEARPIDGEAAAALEDPEYGRRLIEYGETFKRLADPVWDREFREGEAPRREPSLRSGRRTPPAPAPTPGRVAR
ncbi:MAG: radical SAM protein [Planctomycetes bacterium]|nr:radical SAM protein [Planctomycetota bacterium]